MLSRGNFDGGKQSHTCRSDGAAHCWQSCPEDMRKLGVMCVAKDKKDYLRWNCTRGGTRRMPHCPPDRTRHQGLCYKFCPTNSDGVGPLCWHNCKGSIYPASQGALCCKDPAICAEATVEIIKLIANQIKKCFVDNFMNFPACLQDLLMIQKVLSTIPRCQMEFEWPDPRVEYIKKNVWEGSTQPGYDFVMFNPSNKEYIYYDVDQNSYGKMKLPSSIDVGTLSSMYKYDGSKLEKPINKLEERSER